MKEKTFIEFYGVPRSGSTLVRRALYIIFKGKPIPTSHNWIKTNNPLVVTYRDCRDVGVSYWRTLFGQYDFEGKLINKITTEEEIRKIVRITQTLFLSLENCKKYYENKDNVLYLKYEDFWNNYDYLFSEIERFFKVKIMKELRQEVIRETNIESHKKIAKKIKPLHKGCEFRNYDSSTGIHSRHIYTGEPGTWKKIIIPEYHNFFTLLLARELKKWEYEV